MYNFPEQLFATLVHGEVFSSRCIRYVATRVRTFVRESIYTTAPGKWQKNPPENISGEVELLCKFHDSVSIFAHVSFGKLTVPIGYVVVINKFGILLKHCT